MDNGRRKLWSVAVPGLRPGCMVRITGDVVGGHPNETAGAIVDVMNDGALCQTPVLASELRVLVLALCSHLGIEVKL